MKKTEYRVVWKREDIKQKAKRYATLRGAKRFMLLFGDEPWKAFGGEPDDLMCCNGDMCGCGGQTLSEHMTAANKGNPKLEFVRLEQRTVGEWNKPAN